MFEIAATGSRRGNSWHESVRTELAEPRVLVYLLATPLKACTAERLAPMAQKGQVLLVDDLDGGEASETVSFSLDGTAYESDLSPENPGKLRKDLAQHVDHARKGGGVGRPRRATPGP